MYRDRTHDFKQAGRTWYQRDPSTITKITVHHTASQADGNENQILQSIYQGHVNQGWVGLSYHYFYIPERFAGHTGEVIKLNNDSDVTWHDGSNWNSIGFCIHGYYHPAVSHTLTEKDFRIIREFLDSLCTQNPQFPADQNDVYGHREISATACCGDYLFPYIKDYRVKEGDVDWGNTTITFSLNEDIPSTIEDKYSLKSTNWYSKYWNFEDFILDSIKTHNLLEEGLEAIDLLTANFESLKKNLEGKDSLIASQKRTMETLIADHALEEEELTEKLRIANEDIERLKTQKYTVNEALNLLITAIRGGGS